MNPSSKPILITRRNRGGSFFTMLVFVMMLVSTGLMYYYFQRTRSLERQVVALQNGEVPPGDSGSGFLGLLGLVEKKSTLSAVPSETPTVIPASAPKGNPESLMQDIPVSGAASTPTPTPGDSGLDEEPVFNAESSTAEPITLDPSEEMVGLESETEGEPEPADADVDAESEKPGEKQNLESMYDAQPPVRVRAPQRNDRKLTTEE